MTGCLLDVVYQLLAYSWRDVKFRYDELTHEERRIMTREEFDQLVARLREAGHL